MKTLLIENEKNTDFEDKNEIVNGINSEDKTMNNNDNDYNKSINKNHISNVDISSENVPEGLDDILSKAIHR
jgi:hypothetical protein